MAEESSDRRRSPRYVVRDVRGWMTFRSEARVRNLSLTGMSVETIDQLAVGKPYSVRLTHGGTELRLASTVVRSRFRGTRKPTGGGDSVPVYESGIRFDDVLGDKGLALHKLLGAAAEVSLDRRITGRFDLGVPDSVRLRGDYQFEVLKVSATGMLIDAELAPRIDTIFEIGVGLGGEELTTSCRIAYVEPAEGREGHYRLGIEFQGLSPDDRRRLEDFIAREVAGAPPS